MWREAGVVSLSLLPKKKVVVAKPSVVGCKQMLPILYSLHVNTSESRHETHLTNPHVVP